MIRAGGRNEPVPGATVVVSGTSSAAITEADGSYLIEGLPPASYTLEVSAPGYTNATVEARAETAKTTVIDVNIGEMNAGEVIVVTGSRSPEKVLDSPATLAYVSSNDIKRATGASYLSALSKVKGIDYADAGLGDQRISMRGFTTQFNSRLLQMIDGRVAQMPGTGLPQGNSLPTIALDMNSIEIIVGPASALYGPNAHTGVINVITKTPWDESGATVAVRGGSQNLVDVGARVAGIVKDDFGWKVNGQFMRAEDFAPDASRPEHYYGTPFFERDLVGGHYDIKGGKADATLYYKLPDDWVVESTYRRLRGRMRRPPRLGRLRRLVRVLARVREHVPAHARNSVPTPRATSSSTIGCARVAPSRAWSATPPSAPNACTATSLMLGLPRGRRSRRRRRRDRARGMRAVAPARSHDDN